MGLLDTAKELGAKALDKGKETAELAKTKLNIVEAEGNINKILEEVAKDLLVSHPEFLEANYADKFAKIKELKATIETLQASLNK